MSPRRPSRLAVILATAAAFSAVAAAVQDEPSRAAAEAHVRVERGITLNDLHDTPGAVFPVTVKQVCVSGYAGSVRNVSSSTKSRVFAVYGITSHPTGRYEIDHLISLELGGSNAAANLWPELNDHPKGGGLNTKDKLANKLHALVCAGKVQLKTAQHAIATDWVKAYKVYLGVYPVVGGDGSPTPTPTPTSTSTSTAKPPASATPTATPTASAGAVSFTALDSPVSPGSIEHATVVSPMPGDSCDLEVTLSSGSASTSQGLGTEMADSAGTVSWFWKVGSSTDAGTATAIVTCGAGSASRYFTVS